MVTGYAPPGVGFYLVVELKVVFRLQHFFYDIRRIFYNNLTLWRSRELVCFSRLSRFLGGGLYPYLY